MDTNSAHLEPQINSSKQNRQLYIALDGSLKSCLTGPLLELPSDFKEWPHADTNNVLLFANRAA